MNQKKTNNLPKILIVIIVIIVIGLLAALMIQKRPGLMQSSLEIKNKTIALQDAQNLEEETEKEDYATSHKEETAAGETNEAQNVEKSPVTENSILQPITNDAVTINDLYVERGNEAILKSFYPDAEHYSWEIYNMQLKEWETVEGTSFVMDELQREVSICEIPIQTEDSIMVRCRTSTVTEEHEDVATVYVLNKSIKNILIDPYMTDAGTYISSQDIPVKAIYSDGTEETLTGLYGLRFMEETENAEYSQSVPGNGNRVETVTTVLSEKEYCYIGLEEREMLMRYRMDEKTIDTSLDIVGKDATPPKISNVSFGEYEISNIDIPITVPVSITAEDSETPYPYLEYCLVPEGVEPVEEDWIKKPEFEADIYQNGIWYAYCRDRSGNISSMKTEIIVVDQKPPEIHISLENSGWCKNTKIKVDAGNELTAMYNYRCVETGEESGWITYKEYLVDHNGTWEVQVKDAAGNIASENVSIKNIDKQIPVIHGITEAEGE